MRRSHDETASPCQDARGRRDRRRRAGDRGVAVADEDGRTYRITIRNATLGQPIAPSVFATHDAGFTLFQIGGDATLALGTMAETGAPFDLADEVASSGGVDDVVVLPFDRSPPVMLPGESNATTITASGDAKYLSAAGMLAATNDGFYAVRGVALPKKGTVTVRAVAYDAGSEANTEADGQIPATPSGNLDGVKGGDGEGYIHVHAGVHGIADLDPAAHDWRNPVVEIVIERID